MNPAPQPLDIFSHALKAVSNQLLFFAIEFEQQIEIQLLDVALREIYSRLPIARCRFSRANGRYIWERSSIPAIQILTDTELADQIASVGAEQMSCAVQARILRHSSSDTLLLIFDHRFTDAAGARQFSYLLAQYYACQPSLDAEYAPKPDELSHLTAAAIHSASRAQRVSALLRTRFASNHLILPNATNSMQPLPVYAIRKIKLGRFTAMRRQLRSREATLNDLFLSAFGMALAEEFRSTSQSTFSLQFTVDLRRYLPLHLSNIICNLSGAEHITIRTDTKMFEVILLETSRQTQSIKRHTPGLSTMMLARSRFVSGGPAQVRLFRHFASKGALSGRFLPIATNLGYLSSAALRFGSLKVRSASLIGPSLTIAGLMLSMSVFRHELTLSIGYDAGIASRAMVARLLDTTEAIIWRAGRI